ncbi:hypothetical protein DRB10_30620, partial [Klebsiella pneumoniae]
AGGKVSAVLAEAPHFGWAEIGSLRAFKPQDLWRVRGSMPAPDKYQRFFFLLKSSSKANTAL